MRATAGSSAVASVSILVAVAWLLQVLDGVTASNMMAARGIGSELNPLIQAMFVHNGLPGVAMIKMAAAGPLAILFSRLARRGQVRIARLGLVTTGALGLIGCISNLV